MTDPTDTAPPAGTAPPDDQAQKADQAQKGGKEQRRIGLWGATQSGKSTFLSALYIAVNRSPDNDLRIYGADPGSTQFLVRNTTLLNSKHNFPAATLAEEKLAWIMNMRVPSRSRMRFIRPGGGTVPFNFRIDLQDAPGRNFASMPEEEGGPQNRLSLPGAPPEDGGPADQAGATASYLADCHGVLLLIDPLRERDTGDAHEYFHGTLLRMAEEAMPKVPSGERLGHYVAVCVTKFDAPAVFTFAMDNDYRFHITKDPYMFPRVSDSDAQRFLQSLCRGYSKSDIELVTSALGRYFYPERIRYFITSAVGFYVDEEGQFSEDDYQNVVPVNDKGNAEKTYKIRGPVHPINVVEPLQWLGESVAARR